MIEGRIVASSIPSTPAQTDAIRLTIKSFCCEMPGLRNVLYRSTASEVESMKRMASVAPSSAEKIEARVHTPSHLGRSSFIAEGSASSGLDRGGNAAKAHRLSSGGGKARRPCTAE